MSGYGEPEWVSGGQQTGTQEVNEVGQGVTAADATAMERYVKGSVLPTSTVLFVDEDVDLSERIKILAVSK